ncbi:MAG: rhomboid family intramembrane serine protease, partial [Gammaproteobacteria bacterium]
HRCFLARPALYSPSLLPLLMRDGLHVISGQPWRLATSLLVQDGGWGGTVFNLIGLLAIGPLAESLLGRQLWAAVAGISVILTQIVALSWQPIGAGNSILDFGLAGAVCATCLMSRSVRQALIPAVGACTCFVLLVFMRDIHGVAGVIGALAALVFLFFAKRGKQAVDA